MATNKYLDGDGVAQVWAAVKQHVADNAVKSDGYYPALTSGAAESLTSPTAAESTWARRVTDAVDGVAVVDAVLGNTIVRNQWVHNGNFVDSSNWRNNNSGTAEFVDGQCTVTLNTAGTFATLYQYPETNTEHEIYATHKYYSAFDVKASKPNVRMGLNPNSTNALVVAACTTANTNAWTHVASIATLNSSELSGYQSILISNTPGAASAEVGDWFAVRNVMFFDLTRMFGAGNEPSTVAEFEALFPESYYPYDAGSLLSVNLTCVESVGFNQWDEQWEVGGIRTDTGAKITASNCIRSKNYLPVFPETKYRFTSSRALYVFYYDGALNFISWNNINNVVKTLPANCHYILFQCVPAYGTTYNHDICINLSWSGYRNGEYEPYWKSERTIPAATYFPNGMRSAGTIHDELTSDAAIVRVGAVDLGTLDWWLSATANTKFAANVPGIANLTDASHMSSVVCNGYTTGIPNSIQNDSGYDGYVAQYGTQVWVTDSRYADADAFKAAVSGVMLHYILATPTTTPIDPPLTLTYRVEQGGTERITHTNPTAAPTWRIRYPFDLAGTVMANIAPIENGNASTNYAVGSYLVHDGTLCKVTTAIAVGEAITVGTNVTATTVMAEILSLIQ